MPNTVLTNGERFTAFAEVVKHSARTTQQVADALDTTPLRAGNIMRELEDAKLVTSQNSIGFLARQGELLWQDLRPRATAAEQKERFDKKFPGLTTHQISHTGNTQPKARDTRAPLPQQGGDMSNIQFTKATEATSSKKADIVAKMVDLCRKSDEPVPFIKGLCDPAGAKYPQDVEASFMALEQVGLVERYTFAEEGSTRSRVAYKWVGDASRPTPQASTGSKKSSGASKSTAKKTTPAKATKEADAPASA